MELSSYERDFENAKALKTLQENTDPENLVRATKRKVEQAERHVEPESPNRPAIGALTIAQVLTFLQCAAQPSHRGRRRNATSQLPGISFSSKHDRR
jgi:hypothetical protein